MICICSLDLWSLHLRTLLGEKLYLWHNSRTSVKLPDVDCLMTGTRRRVQNAYIVVRFTIVILSWILHSFNFLEISNKQKLQKIIAFLSDIRIDFLFMINIKLRVHIRYFRSRPHIFKWKIFYSLWLRFLTKHMLRIILKINISILITSFLKYTVIFRH